MSYNDITGDRLVSKVQTDSYRDNWENIFGKKEEEKSEHTQDDDGDIQTTSVE